MIFGTDGIRATMGKAPLDQRTIETLSHVIRESLPDGATVVIGGDTRASRETLVQWITVHFGGLRILDLGIVPTPVVAFETAFREAHLGIMITASHNPAADNGLKFFDHEGLKLPFEQAAAWSDAVESRLTETLPATAKPARIAQDADGYRRFIAGRFMGQSLGHLPVTFDFAHGAAAHFGQELVSALGIDADFLGVSPDGTNINAGLGALHTDRLASHLEQNNRQLGFALDGDGDRLILVAPGEHGMQMIHGDVVLYALAQALRHRGETIDAVVGTILCGKGLEDALGTQDIRLIRTPVGDQNVLAKMVEEDLLLGGEPSGHLILSTLFRAGDGLLAALFLLQALQEQPDLLRKAQAAVPLYPTLERALPVREKPPLAEVPAIQRAQSDLAQQLDGEGRLIVRYSGTEPKLRLYMEAPSLDAYQAGFDRLVQAIEGAIG